MKNRNWYPVIAFLSLVGAVISIWQTRLYLLTRSGQGDLHSFCNIGQNFDCTAVEMSKYAEFAPGIPLSVIAIAGYLLILLICLFRRLKGFAIIFTGIAFLFSLIYLFLMITQVGKLCILCLGVDLINTLMFGFAWTMGAAPFSEAMKEKKFLQLTVIGIASLLVAVSFAKAFDPQPDLPRSDLNQMVDNVLNTPVTPLEIPVDAPIVGGANAKVTIVEFGDFQCPPCKLAALSIHPILKRYGDQIKFVFVNFPWQVECNPLVKRKMHDFACEAATVEVCASKQNKFIDAYEALFDNQEKFATGEIANLVTAHAPGFNVDELKACMTQPSTLAKVVSDAEVGIKFEVHSTPTFFVNGRRVEGGMPTNLWIEVIEKLLKQ